jgi:hypothetical protein
LVPSSWLPKRRRQWSVGLLRGKRVRTWGMMSSSFVLTHNPSSIMEIRENANCVDNQSMRFEWVLSGRLLSGCWACGLAPS